MTLSWSIHVAAHGIISEHICSLNTRSGERKVEDPSRVDLLAPVCHLRVTRWQLKLQTVSLFLSREEAGLSKRLCLCQPTPSDLKRPTCSFGACQMVQLIKNLPAMQETPETQVRSLHQEDPLQFSSVTQLCLTLCDPMNCSTPGLPVHHKLPEFTQTHAHRVSDVIQPSHPLSSPSPPAPNPSQHQGLFQ